MQVSKTRDKPKGWDLADYVLSRFSEEEEPFIRDALKKSSEAVKTIIKAGIEPAMNLFNKTGK